VSELVDVAFDAYLFEESGEGFAPSSGAVLSVRVPYPAGVLTRLIDDSCGDLVRDRTGNLCAGLGGPEFDVPPVFVFDGCCPSL
jgi:hypothetical protein